MKTVAVLQSNYIPWKGYFDIIHDVEEFIFHDDLQYTKNDWRNRNKIKTPKGAEWLSIPVGTREDRLICEVELPEPTWARRHWDTLTRNYREAPFFSTYQPLLEEIYLRQTWRHLSELNQHLIKWIAHEVLAIRAVFSDSRAYAPQGVKQARLLDLLHKAGATSYVSGPAAKDYIDSESFRLANIELVWKDYTGYPEYPQFHPPFVHGVTILDLLFQVGPAAPEYIWGWRNAEPVVP